MRLGLYCLALLTAGSCTHAPHEEARAAEDPPPNMVWIPGGEFVMGDDAGRDDEKPAHKVKLDGFFMDRHEVTNAEFARFVSATSYKTVAEIPPRPEDFPGAPSELLVPGALVFRAGKGWSYVPGAQWRHPEGPNSSLSGRENHPVVQVAWEDAAAYAKWAGKNLPTEAQWEYAARAGRRTEHIWGDDAFDDEKPQANIWQGAFPTVNENTDGFSATSPVESFAANGNGLYDMAGNVWEWCADFYRPDAYLSSAAANPKGPEDSFDPAEPNLVKRVVRGGSFLCADCYCRGYRAAARMKSSPDTGLMHTGFRCVINPGASS